MNRVIDQHDPWVIIKKKEKADLAIGIRFIFIWNALKRKRRNEKLTMKNILIPYPESRGQMATRWPIQRRVNQPCKRRDKRHFLQSHAQRTIEARWRNLATVVVYVGSLTSRKRVGFWWTTEEPTSRDDGSFLFPTNQRRRQHIPQFLFLREIAPPRVVKIGKKKR